MGSLADLVLVFQTNCTAQYPPKEEGGSMYLGKGFVRVTLHYAEREPFSVWWEAARAQASLGMNNQAWRDSEGIVKVTIG